MSGGCRWHKGHRRVAPTAARLFIQDSHTQLPNTAGAAHGEIPETASIEIAWSAVNLWPWPRLKTNTDPRRTPSLQRLISAYNVPHACERNSGPRSPEQPFATKPCCSRTWYSKSQTHSCQSRASALSITLVPTQRLTQMVW